MRSDGVYIVSWQDPEIPGASDSPYNILARVFDSSGASVGGDFLINKPDVEQELSTQASPAVAIDDFDNVVIVWAGFQLDGCAFDSHIYARRFKFDSQSGLRDPDPMAGEGPAGAFIVDSEGDNGPFPIYVQPSNPTVALTMDSDHAGRFFVAWNSTSPNTNSSYEVRAQYFREDGRTMGKEFRVHSSTGLSGGALGDRRIAGSGRHAAIFGKQGQALVVWRSHDSSQTDNDEIRVTTLPVGWADYQESLFPCTKCDVNRDGLIDGRDIQPFIDLLLDSPLCLSIVDICPADLTLDNQVTVDDVPLFVCTLVTGVWPCPPLSAPYIAYDCNSNGIEDATDIEEQTSSDCDLNLVPDECEPDCNTNGVPDDCDVNPADPDGNSQVSLDCNGNGLPDECEADCNTNGVPDDCDIDPGDPDGDEWVSPDCNGNGWPDECDLALPGGWGSLDCNTNGIPDECDIASCESDPACGDCNGNHIPDGCDIAAHVSTDADTNGVPDECEGEGMMGGGGSSMMMGGEETGGTPMSPEEEAAWEEYYEWTATQCWGPACEAPTDAQFAAMVAKLQELGLPVRAGHAGG